MTKKNTVMVFGNDIKMRLIESCESHPPLPSWHAFAKNGLTTHIRHALSTFRVTPNPNKSYSMHACMGRNHWVLRIAKGRGVWDTLTLRATVMSLHNLLTSHPHPSLTQGEQIRWTASITWHYTLLLQALFQGNKIWSTLFLYLFHSTMCICKCFCQFGRVCFSTECTCGHSRDCSSVPEGRTEVRSVTREKWCWVPKLLQWANPYFNLPPGITDLIYMQTRR